MDTIEAQLADVQVRHPGARIEQTPDGQRVLVVPGVSAGQGWNMPTVTIKFIVPVGYPQVRPDSFCADPTLRLVSGLEPANSQVQTVLGGQHRWFSWHLLNWDVVNGSLDRYVRFCEGRLRDAR